VVYPNGVEGITISGRAGVGKTRCVRMLTGYGSGVQYGVHNTSMVNLIRGVAERVLYIRSDDGVLTPTRQPDGVGFKRLASVRSQLVRHLRPTTIVPREDYSSLYNGRKQIVYHKAYESLLRKAVHRKDAYLSTFIKAEKVNFTAKGDPAPRVIQPRTPRYNLEVGRYLKLFEKELSRGFVRAFGYSVVCKGLNADTTAHQLRDNWDQFKDPVAFGLDASRFDQHVSVEALRFEHSVYNSVFNSPELARLLEWQVENVGYGRIGEECAKYRVRGCRMSGDINTGMGNCLLMSLMVLGYFEAHGVRARLSNNGDDCVVFCERSDLPRFSGISDWFTNLGFKLKREPTVDCFEKIEFCQTQPVLIGQQWRMVRNPWTAMSKDCVSLLSWHDQASFETWRDAIGVCGGELCSGVPLWESFYASIRFGNRIGGVERVYDSGMGMSARGVRQCVIDEEARYSFWKAFDVTPDQQLAAECSWPGVVWRPPLPVQNNQAHLYSNNLICLLTRAKSRLVSPVCRESPVVA